MAVGCLAGLYGFALSLSRDRALAEDLVQETYLRALSARRKVSPGENLRGWLFTILYNVWRNELRRRRPELSQASVPEAVRVAPRTDDPERALENRRLADGIRVAIEGLPETFREVVLLRCVEGFSYQQIADIVGCPAGTVMSRLARGRALLRQSLSSFGGRGGG